MRDSPDPDAVLAWMRRDWNQRALDDPERHVYSRDLATDETDFYRSGQVNYRQLLQPYLPILLQGRSPRECCVVEIGCGLGRITRWLAEHFGRVAAVDISEEMIRGARERLADCPNVEWFVGSGSDLAMLPDAAFDLAFSYIVFQHIPSRDVIRSYVRETARVLRPGGFFKFQLHGDPSLAHTPDTWFGETFSLDQSREMLESSGFSLVGADGVGTQYTVLTARRGPLFETDGLRPYLYPGEDWAREQLLEGWREWMGGSWRAVLAQSAARLLFPAGERRRFFMGLYLRPDDPFPPLRLTLTLNDTPLGSVILTTGADHDLEFDVPENLGRPGDEVLVKLTVDPPCDLDRGPAIRCLGIIAHPAA